MTWHELLAEPRAVEEALVEPCGMPTETKLKVESAAANEHAHRAETDGAARRYIQNGTMHGLTAWMLHFLAHRLQYAFLPVGGLLSFPDELLVYRNETERFTYATLDPLRDGFS